MNWEDATTNPGSAGCQPALFGSLPKGSGRWDQRGSGRLLLRFATQPARQNAGRNRLAACAPRISRVSVLIGAAVTLVSLATQAAQTPLAQIPFKRDGQLLTVEVRINESAPSLFVVDTGAPHSIFDSEFARELGLEVESSTPVTGTGTGQVTKSKTKPRVMSLNGFKVELPEPWVIDLSKVPIPAGTKGLVGAELFTTFVVRMDPIESRFTVFDPASFQYSGDGASLPLRIENDKLYLDADLEVPAGKITTRKLRIDTGSESSVNDESAKQSEEVRSSTLGGGLGDSFRSYSGVFTSVKIGPYEIKHVWGPGGAPPAIGMEILRRFIITFDAPHGRMYLEPTAALSEPVPTPPPE